MCLEECNYFLGFNAISFYLQQTITTATVVNATMQLQTVVAQATQLVDQSTSNLAIVTTVITQVSNISSPNTTIAKQV